MEDFDDYEDEDDDCECETQENEVVTAVREVGTGVAVELGKEAILSLIKFFGGPFR